MRQGEYLKAKAGGRQSVGVDRRQVEALHAEQVAHAVGERGRRTRGGGRDGAQPRRRGEHS